MVKYSQEGLGETQEMIDIVILQLAYPRQLYGLTMSGERPWSPMQEMWNP